MFNKIKCSKCGEKISGKFDFCPYCGLAVGSEDEDWGLLGKNDYMNMKNANPFQNTMLGGFSGNMLNKMLSGAMKMLEKEMQKEMKNSKEMPMPSNTNFELYINGKRISPSNIKITKKENSQPKKSQISQFSQENIKKFSDLPKLEPLTNVRRLSNKVIYEIDVPGVKSMEDISVSKLENSIEIKAVGKDKAYKKLIPINLPVKAYKLDKDKLILELGSS
ncbi:hypothetical protein HY212_04850 [Candidatus Pacearchaeota archaeon]|nr:hypothetical protein [Candidatus Pacearchaeota archaeon]